MKKVSLPSCQACGELVLLRSEVVRVSYGQLHMTAHPHLQVLRRDKDDYFHSRCQPAFRGETEPK